MERSVPNGSGEDEVQHYLGLLRDGSREEQIAAREALGRVFEERGLLEEAVECYENNILAGVRERGLYERLAALYRRQGLNDLAEEVLVEARKLPPPGSRGAQRGTGRRGLDTDQLEAPTEPMWATRADPADAAGLASDTEPLEAVRSGRRETRPAERPWYASPAFIILSIVLGGPIGLALMWAQRAWSARTRWLVSAAWWGIFLLLFGLSIRSALDSITATVTGQVPTPTAAPTRTISLPPAAPGASPDPSPAASPASPDAGPAAAAAKPGASPSPGMQRVRVANTEGQGANLRAQPSSSAQRLKNVPEGTVLELLGAEQTVDGTVWRRVRDAAGATGWVAADFLEPA